MIKWEVKNNRKNLLNQSWFFLKRKKIDKIFTELTKKKKKLKTQTLELEMKERTLIPTLQKLKVL